MDSTIATWSSYFTKAPGDIWTLLDRAIDHAAEHYPGDFRSRRDAIAERIFAPRPIVNDGSGKAKAGLDQLPNGALSPIRTHLAEEVGIQHNRTSSEVPSSLTEVQFLDEVEGRVLALKNELESSPQASTHAVFTCMIAVSADELLRIFAALDNQRLSVSILRSTEIGKTVNGWRKHSSNEVKEAAKRLVKKWKESFSRSQNNGSGVVSADERDVPAMQRKNSNLGQDDMLLSPRAGILSPGLRLPIDQHNNIGSAESAVMIDDDSDPAVSQHTQDLGQFLEDFLGDETELPATTRTQPTHNRMVFNNNGRSGKVTTPQRQRPSSAPGADGSSITVEDARLRAAVTASMPDSKEDSERRLKAARERLHQNYQHAQDAKKQRTLMVLDPGSLPPQAKHRKVARR
eukprot:jgi/Chlat1/5984/Chrsp4S06188